MRTFCYQVPLIAKDGSDAVIGDEIITMSEDDIRREYYPYWKRQMIHKYGFEAVVRDWSFADCLEDWIVVHMAWEVTDAETP